MTDELIHDTTAPGGAAPVVRVGPFPVLAASQADVVDAAVRGALGALGRRPWFAFALHVGGLNTADDAEFVAAMQAADLVYADGVSVVALARLAGGGRTERSPTTDIGWSVLVDLAEQLGRPVRVALLGGQPGLTERAGAVFAEHDALRVVSTDHGYHDDWAAPLARLREARPDVVVVGLGAPREMTWCIAHRDELPPALVMTCGGWFGFVVQDEKRAATALQRAGLEWVFRLAQDPARLGRRYATGVRSSGALALRIVRQRVADRRSR